MERRVFSRSREVSRCPPSGLFILLVVSELPSDASRTGCTHLYIFTCENVPSFALFFSCRTQAHRKQFLPFYHELVFDGTLLVAESAETLDGQQIPSPPHLTYFYFCHLPPDVTEADGIAVLAPDEAAGEHQYRTTQYVG